MSAPELCPYCDAKMVEYCHSLSKSLARVIYRITQHFDAERRFHVGSIGLTNSQINNTQKLRYWGIIEKEPDSSAKGGNWKLTEAGLAFAQGRISMRKKVWTYRAEVLRFEGAEIYITDVAGGWKYRPDYAREGRPHGPDDPDQGGLF